MTIDDLLPLWNAIAWDDRFAALDVRAKARLPQFSKSVIAAAFPYKMPEEAYGGRNLARYACVADYHEVIRARLEKAIALLREQFPNDQFAAFCDDSPLPEVSLAQRAGLGARGRLNIL
ncbi:MAG: DUF1730 domain-containing protein, partial [Oscillospiraceae bacterium]|nr:DUF1730 domain-containing protein [Oscillospiraceae bacterium]